MKQLPVFALAAMLVSLAPAAEAQQMAPGAFQVGPRVGYIVFDDASPLEGAAFVGADARYFFNQNFGVGFGIDFSRPQVDGSYFKNAIFTFPGNITLLYEPGQQVTQVTYTAFLLAGTSSGRLGFRGLGGGGLYSFYFDPQVIGSNTVRSGNETFIRGMLVVGVGVDVGLTESSGFRIDFADNIFLNFDRERFNPVEPQYQNDRNRVAGGSALDFPEWNGSPPEPKSTLHNFAISVAFQFQPARVF